MAGFIMNSVNQIVIPEYSVDLVMDSVRKSIKTIADAREAERQTALDFYYHKNVDKHIEQWFSENTLKQVPPFPSRIVGRFAKARNLIYKAKPSRLISGKIDDNYNTLSHRLDRKAQEFSEIAWLLGEAALRSSWSEKRQRLEYTIIPQYQTYFKEGESEPFGVSYEIGRKGNNRIFVFWSEARDGQPGLHYKYTQGGEIIKVNDDNVNPYGVMPFSFIEHPSGASDVIRAAVQIGIAQTEIALAERFGFGQPVVTGLQTESNLQLGIDKVLQLGEGANFNFVGSPGDLSKMIEVVRSFADLTAINHHLRIRWDDSGNPASGESLKIQELENLQVRESDVELFRDWEADRYEVDRAVIQTHTGKQFGEQYQVDFAEVGFPKSAKEEREDWDWRFKNKLATREDYFKAMNPDISDEDLKKKLGEIDDSQPEKPQFEGLRKLGTVGS